MNSLLLAFLALMALAMGYRFYSRKVAAWIGIDYEKATPAVELNDGVDYVPARHWTILFGHHFASIAGAAPIIGPVIACLYWGWLPAVVWLVVGGIFFGAVHDFCARTLSVKHQGRSVADLSGSILGKSAKIVFCLFVWLALILVVAVFAALAGKTLVSKPQIVLPTFGLIVVAVFVGLLLYRLNVQVLTASAIGILLLAGLIVGGYFMPIELPVENATKWWTIILLVYGMVAAVLPVTVLLQPRDHLAAFVLFFGMFFGLLGILISRPPLRSPAFVAFSGQMGWLWPMLFVTIACGAISGFHSLVSSGTTSKQLPRMQDACPIGFGAMLAESALGVLAVIAVCAGLYWKQAPSGMEKYVYQNFAAERNWIMAFGEGYGQLTKPILGSLGVLVGITMLKTFVMTTLDSATRITRYISSELLGDAFRIKPLKNRYLATLMVGILAGALALGNWQAIWPIFGAANQLIAAMVLMLVSVYLLTNGRSFIFSVIPAFLMLLTTLGALVYQTVDFLAPAPGEEPKILLATVAVVLLCLGLFIAYQSISVILRARAQQSLAREAAGR